MKRLSPFFLLMMVNCCMASQESPKTPQIESKQQAERSIQSEKKENAEKKTANSASASAPIIAAKAANKNTENKTEEVSEEGSEFWPPLYGFRLKVTDTLLVVFTFLLFIATVALYCATRKLVTGAEDTARRQLRAYLSATPDYIFSFSNFIPVRIKFTIVNHGQTPASKVYPNAIIEICQYPLPKDYSFPELPAANELRGGVIHPNGGYSCEITASRLFTEEEISSATNGQFRIFIFGKVSYVDAFQGQQTTTFCSSIVGDHNLGAVAGGTPIKDVAIKFSPNAQHNEAT